MKFMKFKTLFLLLPLAATLPACGSFSKVVEANNTRDAQHKQFQVNRLNSLQTCYTRATTEALMHGCQMLQMQLQVDQGLTVTTNQLALPETPEQQLLKAGATLVKTAAGVELGKAVIDGLQVPTQVVDKEIPLIVDREVPVFIHTPTPVE